MKPTLEDMLVARLPKATTKATIKPLTGDLMEAAERFFGLIPKGFVLVVDNDRAYLQSKTHEFRISRRA